MSCALPRAHHVKKELNRAQECGPANLAQPLSDTVQRSAMRRVCPKLHWRGDAGSVSRNVGS